MVRRGRGEAGTIREEYERLVIQREGDQCWGWKGRIDQLGYTQLYCRYFGVVSGHVAAWFIATGSFLPDGKLVRHTCDNKGCPRFDHLTSGNKRQNALDYVERQGHWTQHKPENILRGDKHGMAKVSEQDVRDIRRRYADGERQTALAQEYGIDQTNVSLIVRRKKWTHIE